MSLPLREAWIEIIEGEAYENGLTSLPLREAWIEIFWPANKADASFVASLAGSVD